MKDTDIFKRSSFKTFAPNLKSQWPTGLSRAEPKGCGPSLSRDCSCQIQIFRLLQISPTPITRIFWTQESTIGVEFRRLPQISSIPSGHGLILTSWGGAQT